MKIDVMKCIQSPFEDSNWITKVLIGTVLQFLSFLLIPIFAFSGYLLKITKDSAEGREEALPPWTDWGSLIMKGLTYQVGLLLWMAIPLGLMIFGGGSMIMSIVAAFQGGDAGSLVGVAGGTVAMMSFAVGCLLTLVFSVFLPALTLRFAITGQFGSLFQIGGAMADILAAPVDYLIILIAPMAFGLIFGTLTTLTGGLAGILALPVGVIIGIIVSRMMGAFYRECLN